MTELPLHLKQLQPLPSALDIIRFLNDQPEVTADLDVICDGLDISERRFRKAMRRLVTTGYAQMRSDFVYQLTQKGQLAAEELAEHDSKSPLADTDNGQKIQRQVVLAIPRTLVAGRETQIHIGFPADPEKRFNPPADVVLRVSGTYADINADEMIQLGNDVARQSLKLTPDWYDQVRLKVEVFQLSPSGDDVSRCGGMYVDVDVTPDGDEGGWVAYSTDVEFDSTR